MEQPIPLPTESAPSSGAEATSSASAPAAGSSVHTEGSTALASPEDASTVPSSFSAPAVAGTFSPEATSSAASCTGDSQTAPDSSVAPALPRSSLPPLAARSSTAVRLDGAVHGFDCTRGELFLTEAEARAIEEQFIAEWAKKASEIDGGKASRPQWRLQPIAAEAARGQGGGKRSRKGAGTSSRRGFSALSGLLESAGLKLEPTELSASGRPQRSSRSATAASVGPSSASAPADSSSHSASHSSPVSQEASKRGSLKEQSWVPSPWVCWMHEVLVELCKQPVCLPFFPRVSPKDAHYPELARKVFPATPITLESVLDRLERNEYTCTEEVFNDVYTVFLCAFRYYEPGNQYWMMAQEASIVFQSLTQNKPLLSCDFDAFVAGTANSAGASIGPAMAGAAGSHSTIKQNASRVERKARGRDGKSAKGSKGRTTGLNSGGPSTELGNVYRGARAGAPVLPPGSGLPPASGLVTPEEREAFQQILGQLDMEVHLELYSVFKDRAMWLSFGTGEVELDDASTAPEVFREMVAWCRGRLAEKQQRQATSHGLPHAPNVLSPSSHSAPSMHSHSGVARPPQTMMMQGAGAYMGMSQPVGNEPHGVTHPTATKRPAVSTEAGNLLPSPPTKKQRASVADSASSSSSDDGSDDDY
ncbi:bromodomain protein [Toxoplasma gondii GAB2-2007-GAL-DOM2]|uniref:Bromodomain protein n=2 Tax=Toxoplasma gondii TaxID=5811 RepID=V4YUG7_TOXGV|nr:bromodomain protein [Toxoplasma gondii VEG]KFG30762.1 bromodomain protein [Toxoplasma gondii GAB2-2007-GAL-DOM2]KFG34633.1 bromodomain protein [Toxoplasma gondii p89]